MIDTNDYRLLSFALICGLFLNMLFEHKINILAEIAVVRFGQIFDSSYHIFIKRDTYFAFQWLLSIHVIHYKQSPKEIS